MQCDLQRQSILEEIGRVMHAIICCIGITFRMEVRDGNVVLSLAPFSRLADKSTSLFRPYFSSHLYTCHSRDILYGGMIGVFRGSKLHSIVIHI